MLANLDTVLQHEYQGSDPRYCTALFGLMEPDADGFTVTLAGGGTPLHWRSAHPARWRRSTPRADS